MIPVHCWYPYITGFASDLVASKIKKYDVPKGGKILDPYGGVGTVSVEAKMLGYDSISTDANPFICFVAKTKLNWDLDIDELGKELKIILKKSKKVQKDWNKPNELKRVFTDSIFEYLMNLRSIIEKIPRQEVKDFFLLGLICILRDVSNCKNSYL